VINNFQAFTVEKSAQTDPLSCLRNYSGPTVEDLMLLARQQIREAPIILARWSRTAPVSAGDIVRFQREMQRAEAEKHSKMDAERRREAEKLKQRISMSDYKNRKHTPKPLSKLSQAERRYQEAHMGSSRREHKSSSGINGDAPIAPVSETTKVDSPSVDDIGQAVSQRLVSEEDIARLPSVDQAPDSPGTVVEDEPMSYTPPGNSPGSPEPVPAPVPSPFAKSDTFDVSSIVKTGSSFMSCAADAQSHLSLEERIRQTIMINSQIIQREMKSAPQPVPVSFSYIHVYK
jgi:hypothetical protein